MYTRRAERHGFQWKTPDYEDGDETGINFAIIMVPGENAYGRFRGKTVSTAEVEASVPDYTAGHPPLPLGTARHGQSEYTACCRLMYACYKAGHAVIDPLNADTDTFCTCLPAEALYESAEGKYGTPLLLREAKPLTLPAPMQAKISLCPGSRSQAFRHPRDDTL